ncbi:M28 family peptidase [Altericroceibacterium xinjiangense]|uniref:M28 family peptidase n=1 Tax=Altericroceibacterium xinjiangense TaxID=762261 RepID=UPI000F7D7506|nr:M28 family peptidase [Altericroceibacterium xinjiangense]
MHKLLISAALLAVSSAAAAQTTRTASAPPAAAGAASVAAASVSEQRLRQDVETLVSFGTRHTLSEQDNPRRGIGAAWTWGENEFRKISQECGNCLEVVLPETTVSGDRIPEPVRLIDVVAIQRGTERPNEVVIVQGHIDSRASDVMDAVSDAPGANDDASGTALAVEAARVLSKNTYPSTIVYALLTGEEQGLYGGKLLANYAKQQGWTVKAVLNNDIVGGSCGSDGFCDAQNVRVFSEGPRADAGDKDRAAMRRNGGENDSPGRNLSRYIAGLAAQEAGALDVRQIWRTDRMGRGGDQIPFLEHGFPAVRFTVAVEDYEHQHQDLRVEDGVTYGDTIEEMDFPYLANVTRLNVRALDALARAPLPPSPVAEAAVQTFTDIRWDPVPGAARYNVWRRRTDQPAWEAEPIARTDQAALRLEGLRGDDWILGVSSVSAQGAESPVASAVPGGGFHPLEKR